ncbi:rhomboid family intramembrane serine protease [Streptococcus saliviloxodontae]|uniref:Membrane associated rhomboid family serine protease n=1 Tax=Streptococcus saliviloxodontae TaxID=1349416 RepID=A0ABS2PJ99_9STRE|nr:rhomboid family intramembrane serine protease [Streptococcus saliviloxodontae]MBM7635508.1 membrane associated rhomboid family serine protease [Streptococcus saliviloxodontae]
MLADFKKTPITLLLVILTSLIFLTMQLFYFGNASSSQAVFQFGGMYGDFVRYAPSQIWRLVTPIFVHIGWEHFIMNSLTLYFVGSMAERVWGSLRFLLLYLLSGIMGNLFTLLLTPGVVSAGASTSLFGLFAAFAVVGYYGRSPYLQQVGKSYLALIIMNLFVNLFMTNVGMAGHIGGAIGGLLASLFLPTQVEPLLFDKSKKLLGLLGYIVIACLILIFVFR